MDWIESLPEELKTEDNLKTLKRFESPAELAKSYMEARRNLSSSIRLPSEHSDEDQKKEIFTRIQKHYPDVLLRPDPDNKEQSAEFWALYGVPDDVDGYEGPEDIKGLPDELLEALGTVAKDTKLNRDQYKALVAQLDTMYHTGIEKDAASKQELEQALKNAWGLAYDERRDRVNNLVTQFQDENDPISELPPAVQKMLFNMSKNMSGQAPNGAEVGQKEPAYTDDELRTKLEDLKRSKRYKDAVAGRLSINEKKAVLNDVMKLRQQLARESPSA
jgi:hypothetical protein